MERKILIFFSFLLFSSLCIIILNSFDTSLYFYIYIFYIKRKTFSTKLKTNFKTILNYSSSFLLQSFIYTNRLSSLSQMYRILKSLCSYKSYFSLQTQLYYVSVQKSDCSAYKNPPSLHSGAAQTADLVSGLDLLFLTSQRPASIRSVFTHP